MFGNFGRYKCNCSLYYLWLLLSIVLCICSCTSEYNIFDNENSKLLNFTVSVPSWENNDSSSSCKTRATPISGTSLDRSSSFNIIADAYDGKSSYSNIIKDEPVSFTNNMWQTTASHYWSGTANNTLNFYAYYPTTISNSVTHTAGSAPTLSYTVPNDAVNQIDIMTATSNNVSGSTNSSTPLTFSHIFAAIQFSVGSNGLGSGTISSISIGNVYDSGKYTFGSGWTLGTSMKTFSIIQPKNISGTSDEDIYSGTYTLMMIPQTITNATITITYSNGGTLSKTISGIWETGKTYNYKISYIREYNYTGDVQSFTAPISGTYKIECWGASGGTNSSSLAGRGGYVCGNLKLDKNRLIYIYVGGLGKTITSIDNTNTTVGGYNGGGTCLNSAAAGGGATDIRLIEGLWNDFTSLKSRILVAGGGGGENNFVSNNEYQIARGGCGGNLQGGTTYSRCTNIAMYGGTQTSGGITNQNPFDKIMGQNGLFGIGGNAASYGGGGGGGYYGGAGGCNAPGNIFAGEMPGSGGSSFISGYTGCNAISESSTSSSITHTNSPIHYSKLVFTNSIMVAGTSSMISPTGTTEIGHGGNGYARITFVSAN